MRKCTDKPDSNIECEEIEMDTEIQRHPRGATFAAGFDHFNSPADKIHLRRTAFGQFGLALFDIELEFFYATNTRFVDEGTNAFCLLKQGEVVVAGHLNADRSARGRPLAVLVHRDLYARITPDAFPYFFDRKKGKGKTPQNERRKTERKENYSLKRKKKLTKTIP